jgi:SAM-dependent methyltransferase
MMLNKRISGDEHTGWLQHCWNKHISKNPNARVLILGSSEGRIETFLCQAGHKGSIVASDIAEKAVARAEKEVRRLGYGNVEYVLADLNEPLPFTGPFDFIIAEGVLHHIANIEQCLRGLHERLAPTGKFLALEFIGPFRFQISDIQLRWIQSLLNVLPRSLRKPLPKDDRGHWPATGEENLRYHFQRFSEEWVVQFDPSEALSGPQLRDLVPEIFKLENFVGFGGTILSYIPQHFDFAAVRNDPIAERWLQLLIDAERILIDSGTLQDEFVAYEASRR